MSSEWEKNNSAYLTASLKWLRLRLTRFAEQNTPLSESASSAPPGPPPRRSGRGRLSASAGADPQAVPPRSNPISDDELAQAEAEMRAAGTVDPPPAMVELALRLQLSSFELEILLMCVAMELDTRIAGLIARAHGDPGRPNPTFALALACFDEPAWDALSSERPLRYWRLIEIAQSGSQPLTLSALRADERIINFVKGLNFLDDRLAPLLASMDPAGAPLPPSQQKVALAIWHHLRSDLDLRDPVIQLTGSSSASKEAVALQVAAVLGRHIYRLPVENLPTQASELEDFIRLWQRETVLLPVLLYVDAREIERPPTSDGGAPSIVPLSRFLSRSQGLCLLDTYEARSSIKGASAAFEVVPPTPREQEALWTEALGDKASSSPALLAGQFNLDSRAIHHIARQSLEKRAEANEPLEDRLWVQCLVHTRPRLESLAQRLIPRATWDDLVLPVDATVSLRQIADQVRHRTQVYDDWGFRDRMSRGLGISVLFCGESGTGKTMAAEVIANDLRLDLYRIDLSAVVSKYIGETEKNLRRLFDAAEDGGAILFFDEADALFGKRSEVKDSHDRYANIEINYLLQRMEAYRGLAILATNMKSALDTAFVRRLRFIISFPFPTLTERRRMWQKAFPRSTPIAGLDFDRLARLNLNGGSVVNIALNAAFLATSREPPQVTMPVMLEAVRAEFRKLERPTQEADLALGTNGGAL